MVFVIMEIQGIMLVGIDIFGVLVILEFFFIDILGLNCVIGLNLMIFYIKYLLENLLFFIFCIFNVGLLENIGGQVYYKMILLEFKMFMFEFIGQYGV